MITNNQRNEINNYKEWKNNEKNEIIIRMEKIM